MPNALYRSLKLIRMYCAVFQSLILYSYFSVIVQVKKYIDTLKGPFNILEDDKLFDDSTYCKSNVLPKCNPHPKHTKNSMEEESGYKTLFTRIVILFWK